MTRHLRAIASDACGRFAPDLKIGTGAAGAEVVDEVTFLGAHVVPPEFGADFVGSDEAMGGRLVASHLYELGHRRIGFITGNWNWGPRRASRFRRLSPCSRIRRVIFG